MKQQSYSNHKMVKATALAFFGSLLFTAPLRAEGDVTIQGIVVDAATQQPLAGVRVQAFDNARISAMTDEKGAYTLKLPEYAKSIWLECDGYSPIQVSAKAGNGATLSLYSSAFKSDYSHNMRATSVAEASDLNYNSADICIDDQLASELGAQVYSLLRSGTPGMGNFMLVGGINSLNANTQPLIVLDGVILDMQYDVPNLHNGFYNNILANLSVEDIAKVEVLRNGTALYGGKAANGVILITTKRNRSLVTKIDVSLAGQYQMLPKSVDMMNAGEYRSYASEMLQSTGIKTNSFKFLRDDPEYFFYPMYHNNTDWKDYVYEESFAQVYSINVQGGDDAANYNLSVGYAQSDATQKNNNYNRFNLRLNSDLILSERFKIRFDAAYSDVNRELRDDGAPGDVDNNTITAPGFLSLIKAPFLSPYDYDKQGNLSSFLAGADDYLDGIVPNNEASLANPASILHYGEAKNKNSFGNRFINLSIQPRYEFKNGITLSEHFAFSMTTTDANYYLPNNGVPSFEVEELDDIVKNEARSMASHQYQTSSDTRIAWAKKKEAHHWNVQGGFRFLFNAYELNGMLGYNTGNDKTPNMSSNLDYAQTNGIDESVTDLHYYAMGDYSYANRFYAHAGLAMTTNSRIGNEAKGLELAGVRWGIFPSVAGAWVISNEDWFPVSQPGINFLKVNLGFDMSGNDDIELTASRTNFRAKLFQNRRTGTVINNIGNTSLGWERTSRITFGADMNLIDNRLNIAFNGFKSWTNDLLSYQSLSYLLGVSQSWNNGGSLENAGFDVTLSGKVINTRNWHWSVGGSVGHYRNKLTKLPDGKESFTTDFCQGTILSKVGEPVGLFYGYKTNGIYRTSAEASADAQYRTDKSGNKIYFQAGDVRFLNLSGADKEINADDRTVIGNPNPDVYGNIFSHLKYKNWSLDVLFKYSVGNDVYNYQRALLEGGSHFFNQTTALNGRWRAEGQQTDIPRISYLDEMGNSRFSDRWIEDGSYLRLKNVTLSYDWGIENRYIQGMTFWVAANNLFTLTKYLGSDPEFSASNNVLMQGIDCGLLPQSRTCSVGIKIKL